MGKFHINREGVPAPCKAEKGRCPFGGSDRHFDSLEEAEGFVQKVYDEQFGLLGVEARNEHILWRSGSEGKVDRRELWARTFSVRQ